MKSIVEGNTWATFMAFSKEWARNSQRTKKLERYLPCIYEIEDDNVDDNIQVDKDDITDQS